MLAGQLIDQVVAREGENIYKILWEIDNTSRRNSLL